MSGRYIGEIIPVKEPTPLNNKVDPEKLTLWREYTKGDARKARELLRDSSISDPTIRQHSAAVFTAPSQSLLIDCGNICIGNLVTSPDGPLREQFACDRRLAKEIAIGILYWYPQAVDYINSDQTIWQDYQNAIYCLLPPLYDTDKKLALEIFEIYKLKEFEAYDGDFSCSRYQPIRGLLHDPEMPRKIKDLALEKWFEIARSEESGQVEPRAKHERAVNMMADYIDSESIGNSPDKKVINDIVQFLEEISSPNIAYLGDLRSISDIAKLIDNDALRFKLARRSIMFGKRFSIHNKNDEKLVEWVLKLAHKRGQSDCIAKAQSLLDAYSERQQRSQVQRETEALNEKNLLDAIRK